MNHDPVEGARVFAGVQMVEVNVTVCAVVILKDAVVANRRRTTNERFGDQLRHDGEDHSLSAVLPGPNYIEKSI